MKYEYKVIEALNGKDAEEKMNLLAKQGWRVHSVTFWSNFKRCLLITFEREIK